MCFEGSGGSAQKVSEGFRDKISKYEASLLIHLTMIISNHTHTYMSVNTPDGQPQVSLEYEEEQPGWSQWDHVCAAYAGFTSDNGADKLERPLNAVPILDNNDHNQMWISLFSDEPFVKGIQSDSAIPGLIGKLATATMDGKIVPRAKKGGSWSIIISWSRRRCRQ